MQYRNTQSPQRIINSVIININSNIENINLLYNSTENNSTKMNPSYLCHLISWFICNMTGFKKVLTVCSYIFKQQDKIAF